MRLFTYPNITLTIHTKMLQRISLIRNCTYIVILKNYIATTPFAEDFCHTKSGFRDTCLEDHLSYIDPASIAASLTCLRIENLLRLAALHQEEDGPAAVVAAALVGAPGRRPDGLWRPEAGKDDLLLAQEVRRRPGHAFKGLNL
jgi:hypothetical protein